MEVLRKKQISEVHFQHRVWLSQLTFYKEEFKIFQERLKKIALKSIGKEVQQALEQFQHKFIIQNNEIDRLEHLIKENEKEAVRAGQIHLRRIDYEATEQYANIRSHLIHFGKLFKELKDDFYKFLRQECKPNL